MFNNQLHFQYFYIILYKLILTSPHLQVNNGFGPHPSFKPVADPMTTTSTELNKISYNV